MEVRERRKLKSTNFMAVALEYFWDPVKASPVLENILPPA